MGMLLSGKCLPGKPQTPSSVARTEKNIRKKTFSHSKFLFDNCIVTVLLEGIVHFKMQIGVFDELLLLFSVP